jgi:hypothetical protein
LEGSVFDHGPIPEHGQKSEPGSSIERVWLTHGRSHPDHVVVNWLTDEPGDSVVGFRRAGQEEHTRRVHEPVSLHHVEIPLGDPGRLDYRVCSNGIVSEWYSFDAYSQDELRIGVVADWQQKPNLEALIEQEVHLLLSAGDNIPSLHRSCTGDPRTNIQPFAELIEAYPQLFRSTIFMPVLGNHDREIRPRGHQPPSEPVYDVDATAFCSFFPLPDDRWKWRLDLSEFDLEIVALDLCHITDQGNSWQACHALHEGTEQYQWFRGVSETRTRRFRLTVHNENNALMREQADGKWGTMLSRSTAVVSGFGYFGERAVIDGVPYFNTCLASGDLYPDPCSEYLTEQANFMILRLRRGASTLQAEIRDLSGIVLDETQWPSHA